MNLSNDNECKFLHKDIHNLVFVVILYIHNI